MPTGLLHFKGNLEKKLASIQNEIPIYYISIFIKILVMCLSCKVKM